MQAGDFIFAAFASLNFVCYSNQPISQGVTLLFFFTEKKKRSKKRKEFAFHLYYTATSHPKITRKIEDTCNIFPQILINKTPPAGHTGGLPAVTLPFLHLKLGRKVSGDSPLLY